MAGTSPAMTSLGRLVNAYELLDQDTRACRQVQHGPGWPRRARAERQLWHCKSIAPSAWILAVIGPSVAGRDQQSRERAAIGNEVSYHAAAKIERLFISLAHRFVCLDDKQDVGRRQVEGVGSHIVRCILWFGSLSMSTLPVPYLWKS